MTTPRYARGSVNLRARVERWPIAEAFHIARGVKTHADVVVVEARAGGEIGRGEAVPYPRYDETPERVVAAVPRSIDRKALAQMPAGAARNAIDLALWDLESKRAGARAHELAGVGPPAPLETARTIVIGSEEHARRTARVLSSAALLKVKVGGELDLERVRAIREELPRARLIVDANEGWSIASLERLAPALLTLGVELIEQPLPAAEDAALARYEGPIPICADESAHGTALEGLADRYDAVCLKLDKQGGLTGALLAERRAREAGLEIMVGCMVSTSLAIAPGLLLAQRARWVDLDGALLLARDRDPALPFDGVHIGPIPEALWG